MFNVLNVNERLYDAFMKERKGKKRSVHAVSKICGTDKRAFTVYKARCQNLRIKKQEVCSPSLTQNMIITPQLHRIYSFLTKRLCPPGCASKMDEVFSKIYIHRFVLVTCLEIIMSPKRLNYFSIFQDFRKTTKNYMMC